MATLNGTSGDDILVDPNPAGADTINGLAGNDEMAGGNGDTLNGGTGDDTYDYIAGLLNYTEASGNGYDQITLNVNSGIGGGYDFSGIDFYRDANNNLIIDIDSTDKITLANQFAGGNSTFEDLHLSDGRHIDLTTKQYETHGTSGNDTINGIVSGGSTNDIIYGYDGNDSINAGTGNDYLDGGIGNDTLYGGTGDDIYYYTTGYGIDTLSENVGGGNDIIQLGSGINLSDLTFIRDWNTSSLIISLDASNQIKLQSHFSNVAGYIIETLKLSDGSTIDLITKQYETHGTNGNDNISGITQNGSINDILYGHDGNDTLNAGSGNDYLDGGIGNDTLYGGAGDDIYYYTAGY